MANNTNNTNNTLSVEELRKMLQEAEAKQVAEATAGVKEAFDRLKKNRKSAKGSTRDHVAIAYMVANGGKLTNKDTFTGATVQALFTACGEPLADKDGQYRQGVPQLLSCANALGVELTITVKEIVENESK